MSQKQGHVSISGSSQLKTYLMAREDMNRTYNRQTEVQTTSFVIEPLN